MNPAGFFWSVRHHRAGSMLTVTRLPCGDSAHDGLLLDQSLAALGDLAGHLGVGFGQQRTNSPP